MIDPDETTRLPLANEEREATAKKIFSEYMTMSPEEWAEKFGKSVCCSSFDGYSYRDDKLHEWIHRLHRILSGGY